MLAEFSTRVQKVEQYKIKFVAVLLQCIYLGQTHDFMCSWLDNSSFHCCSLCSGLKITRQFSSLK